MTTSVPAGVDVAAIPPAIPGIVTPSAPSPSRGGLRGSPARPRGRDTTIRLLVTLLPVVVWAWVLGATSLATAAGGGAARQHATIVVVPGATTPLDLSACVEEALRANPDLQGEREERRAVRGRMLQAISDGLPSLDANGDWTRGRDPSFALDATFGGDGEGLPAPLDSLFAGFDSFVPLPEDVPTQTFWRASIDGRWELRPFKIYNTIRGAGLLVEQQEQRVAGAEQRTIEATLQAYYRALQLHERLQAVEAELEARRELLAVTRRRMLLDMATSLDTLQAAVALANLEPERRRARRNLLQAGQDLNVLLGRDPRTPLRLANLPPVEEEPVEEDVALSWAVRRPDVRQQELEVGIQRRTRGARKAEIHPYLTLSGSYGYVTRRLEDLTDRGHDYWRADVRLTLPLFDGLLTKGQVKETEARLRRAEFEAQAARRRARQEVLDLLGELDVERANLKAARLNLARAEEALRRVSLRYELGKADYLEVLNAQADRFAARSNLIESRFTVLMRTASLKRAMGIRPTLSLASATAAAHPE